MKKRAWKMEAGAGRARSVLECGSPLPLLTRHQDFVLQSAGGPAQSKIWRLIAAAMALVMVVSVAVAQSYSVDWYKIAGGGGTSTGGTYQVNGTIGQPDAGTMSGGNYSLTGGFWSLISAVQTPGAPTLTITHSGNDVIVSWPPPSTGWTLQQNGNLATTKWTSFGGTVNSNSTTLSVTLPSPRGNLFFRLSHP
jgi:hypothetical protein